MDSKVTQNATRMDSMAREGFRTRRQLFCSRAYCCDLDVCPESVFDEGVDCQRFMAATNQFLEQFSRY